MRSSVWLLVALLLRAAAAAPAQRAGDVKIEAYVFETANKQKVDAELGRLLVPENRRNPRSRLIELAFVRFKSTSLNPGPPIIYLAGGPGGSGIIAARGTRFPLFLAMREIGDVIALDQRGTGMSKPNLVCRESCKCHSKKRISAKRCSKNTGTNPAPALGSGASRALICSVTTRTRARMIWKTCAKRSACPGSVCGRSATAPIWRWRCCAATKQVFTE